MSVNRHRGSGNSVTRRKPGVDEVSFTCNGALNSFSGVIGYHSLTTAERSSLDVSGSRETAVPAIPNFLASRSRGTTWNGSSSPTAMESAQLGVSAPSAEPIAVAPQSANAEGLLLTRSDQSMRRPRSESPHLLRAFPEECKRRPREQDELRSARVPCSPDRCTDSRAPTEAGQNVLRPSSPCVAVHDGTRAPPRNTETQAVLGTTRSRFHEDGQVRRELEQSSPPPPSPPPPDRYRHLVRNHVPK